MIHRGPMNPLLLILATAFPAFAATTIEISAKFADVPAGTVISTADKLEKMKGVNLLSAPKVVTGAGQKALVEVIQSQSAPGGVSVPLGLTLEITPTLDDANINFTARATDRAMHGKRNEGRINVVEFATREVYFSGSTNSGQTVFVHTAPSVTKGDGKVTETKTRELVILLTFQKKTTEAETGKKAATSKKPATSTKAATSKGVPVKKKK